MNPGWSRDGDESAGGGMVINDQGFDLGASPLATGNSVVRVIHETVEGGYVEMVRVENGGF